MNYTQLSQDERNYISHMRRHLTFTEIAKNLGRSTSTITREYTRNLRPSGYYAAYVANSYATARRRSSRRGSQFSNAFWKTVESLIRDDLSPEQVLSKLQERNLESISIQSIYRYIRKDRKNGGDLYKHLRIMPKVRRKRYKSEDSRGVLRGKLNISERPLYINDRSEFGHWEGDTVMGKDHHQCILTLVERKTGLNRIAKLDNRTAFNVNAAIVKMILKEPHLFKSITFDNGTEFHGYKSLEEITGVTCYFANPHHPWERGCNENFNGLLRQYFPKGKTLSYIGTKKLEYISDKLNNRPRKRLGFKSPKEALNAVLQLLG